MARGEVTTLPSPVGASPTAEDNQKPRVRESAQPSLQGHKGGHRRAKSGSGEAVRASSHRESLSQKSESHQYSLYIHQPVWPLSFLEFFPHFFHICLQIPLLIQGSTLMPSKWCKRLASVWPRDLPSRPGPQHSPATFASALSLPSLLPLSVVLLRAQTMPYWSLYPQASMPRIQGIQRNTKFRPPPRPTSTLTSFSIENPLPSPIPLFLKISKSISPSASMSIPHSHGRDLDQFLHL